jgi:hypothetical protein
MTQKAVRMLATVSGGHFTSAEKADGDSVHHEYPPRGARVSVDSVIADQWIGCGVASATEEDGSPVKVSKDSTAPVESAAVDDAPKGRR